MYDLCVIGAGAAGLSAAIKAARFGKKVIIFDKNAKPGKKLYATGNGKCNVTNLNFNISSNFMSNSDNYIDFLNQVLGDSPAEKTIEFLQSVGILTYNQNGYVYPITNQASSVVWALLDELSKYNIEIKSKTEIYEVILNNDKYTVKSASGDIEAYTVLIACGGKSYESLGGCSLGYSLSKANGHTVTNLMPSLCGLVTKEDLSPVSGVRIQATASLYDGQTNDIIAKESGELQLTDYGVSGIMIFNLSSKAGKLLNNNKAPYLSINLLPNIDFSRIENLYNTHSNRSLLGFFNGFVNDKISLYFINKNNINPKIKLSEVSKETVMDIYKQMTNFKLYIKQLKDFDNAQVTSGGVCLDEIDPLTMMSKIKPGLFFAGEVIDIDGICGGYNITFAMLSGLLAGESASKYNIYRGKND